MQAVFRLCFVYIHDKIKYIVLVYGLVTNGEYPITYICYRW